MPLEKPKILGVQGAFELGETGRDQARDDEFIAAIRREFPHVQNRQMVPPETPLQAPHLILASQSAQLTLSAVMAEMQLQFYGEYTDNPEKALPYAERKLSAIYEALNAASMPTSSFGAVVRMHFPAAPDDQVTPPQHVLETLTKVNIDAADLEDTAVKVALKVAGTYFVHLTVENYEVRSIEQFMQPGFNVQLQPWRGKTAETGIELAIDVNNKWERRRTQQETRVTESGLTNTVKLLSHLALVAGPKFAETGEISADELTSMAHA